jgi:hypothetical protein
MEIQCQGKTKAGERCKKAASAFSDFCAQHRAAIRNAETVELPEFIGELSYDPAAPNVHEQRDADGNVTGVFIAELKDGQEPVGLGVTLDEPSGWTEMGATEQGWKIDPENGTVATETSIDLQGDTNAKSFSGFKARKQPTPRCRERSCFKVRGHGGKHENGSVSIATCSAKGCRLPLGHPDAHGVPAKERVRIGELTGKL